MTEDFFKNPFHGHALRAFVEIWAETKQYPPDSEAVKKRAYRYYEESLKNLPITYCPPAYAEGLEPRITVKPIRKTHGSNN